AGKGEGTGSGSGASAFRLPTSAFRTRLWLIPAGVVLWLAGWSFLGLQIVRTSGVLTPGEFWSPLGWVTGFQALLESAQSLTMVDCLVLLLAVAAVWAHPRVLGIGLTWTFAFLAPLAMSPGPLHRQYIPQCGYLLI